MEGGGSKGNRELKGFEGMVLEYRVQKGIGISREGNFKGIEGVVLSREQGTGICGEHGLEGKRVLVGTGL